MELENWVNSIHSACAAAFARHRGKTGTLHLLQEEIFRLEKAIESVSIVKYPFQYNNSVLQNYSYHLNVKKEERESGESTGGSVPSIHESLEIYVTQFFFHIMRLETFYQLNYM